jgi:hypothetical protein
MPYAGSGTQSIEMLGKRDAGRGQLVLTLSEILSAFPANRAFQDQVVIVELANLAAKFTYALVRIRLPYRCLRKIHIRLHQLNSCVDSRQVFSYPKIREPFG